MCDANLQECVEGTSENPKIKPLKSKLDLLDIFHQASKGLRHLHQLKENKYSVTVSVSERTGGWMAPELLHLIDSSTSECDSKVTLKSDIYSMGCILHYVETNGKHPFGEGSVKRNYRIMEGIYTEMQLPRSHEFYDLIKSMIDSDPEVRPTANEIVNHLAFKSPGPSSFLQNFNNNEAKTCQESGK